MLGHNFVDLHFRRSLFNHQPEIALETWQQAEKIYRSLKDVTGIVLSQINQAQALQTLEEYRRAQRQLEQVNQYLSALPNNLLKARGLGSLSVTLQVARDLVRAQQVLFKSLAIAKLVVFATEPEFLSFVWLRRCYHIIHSS